MEIRGSSSMIVPVPEPSVMRELVAPLRLTVKASFDSPTRSPRTAIVNVSLVCPAGRSRSRRPAGEVAAVGGRSAGRRVVHRHVLVEAAESVTVKVMVLLPVFPSLTAAGSLMEICGSSSMMVPIPCPSATGASARGDINRERLVRFPLLITQDRDREGRGRVARWMVTSPETPV